MSELEVGSSRGVRIGVLSDTHIPTKLPTPPPAQVLPDAEVIVFGQSHLPVIRTWEGRLLVNPGAVANRHHPTCGLLHVGVDELWAEIVDLEG